MVRRCSPWIRRLSRTPIAGLVETSTARSKPGTRSRRKRKYSCDWRRPSSSAAVSASGSVASTPAIRVMRHITTPSCGVRWIEPSRRGRRYAPSSTASRMSRHSVSLGAILRHVHAGEPEHRRERLRPPVGRVVGRAGQVADVRVPAGVDHDPRADRPDAALRREPHRVDAAVGVAPGREGEAVQQQPHARLGRQRLPHALERLGVVGDAGARAVGVRPLEARVLRAEPGDHVVGDAGDDLVRDRARRVERVEGVQDARRRAAEEAEPVHEQRLRPGAGRGDGSGRAGGSGAHHQDVDALVVRAHLCNYTLI